MTRRRKSSSLSGLGDFIARLQQQERERRLRTRGPRSYVVLYNPDAFPNAWLPTAFDAATERLTPIFNIDPADGVAPVVAVFPTRRLANQLAEKSAEAVPRGLKAFILAPAPTQSTPVQGGAK